MEKPEELIVLVGNEKADQALYGTNMVDPRQGKAFFEGPFDDAFWNKVEQCFINQKIPWSEALSQAHYERALREAKDAEKDPAVFLIVDVVNQFWALDRPHQDLVELFPSYEKHVTSTVKMVLEKEKKDEGESVYEYHLEPDKNDIQYTLLHLATMQNLKEVVQLILDRYEGLQYVETDGEITEKLPIEYALDGDCNGLSRDGTAALLLRSMLNERVRLLFQSDDDDPPRVSFLQLVQRKDMKCTVAEVLNAMINPDWPFVLVKEGDEGKREKAWQTDPNLPIRYHFFFQILDQDEKGHAPKIARDGQTAVLDENPGFNHKSDSAMKALAYGPMKKFAVKHPVVRHLIDFKWRKYGNKIIWFHAAMYLLFLILLSLSFCLAGDDKDVAKYNKPIDLFRAVCEIGTLLFSVVYLIDEFDQMDRERSRYLKDFFNYLDLFGLLLIFTVIPLRFLDVTGQWYVASLAFIVNFIRGAKYLFAWKSFGVYGRVLIEVLKKDLTIFLAFYTIVLCAFTGGIFLAMRGAKNLDKVNGFADIILRGVRALFEGKEFADDYAGFNLFVLLIILANMLVIIVFLLNMLIAQLSNRYEVASQEAAVQYDIDKISLVAKIENSRFRCLNLRTKFYVQGDYINDIEKIENYISIWNETVKQFGLGDKKQMLEDAQELWTKKNC